MKSFSELLTTPHAEILEKGGIEPEPLTDSTRVRTIRAAYGASEKAYNDQVEAAYATANLVKDTLRFETYQGTEDWLTAEEMRLTQRTNCHGYSIVLSENLEALSIPHYIGFANGHSFILLQSDNGRHTHFIDTPVKELHTNIEGVVSAIPFAEQHKDGTSIVGVLDSKALLERSDFLDRQKEIYERPWLSFTRSGMTTPFKLPANQAKDFQLILRAYAPKKGRQVLDAYGNFVLAMRRDRYEEAHDRLQCLGGEYPEIDRRNRFREPTRLVRTLARKGQVAKALSDIEIVERSLWPTDDLLVNVWPSDERRRIGAERGQPSLIARSIEEYTDLLEERADIGLSTHALRARITKAKEQWKTSRAA